MDFERKAGVLRSSSAERVSIVLRGDLKDEFLGLRDALGLNNVGLARKLLGFYGRNSPYSRWHGRKNSGAR